MKTFHKLAAALVLAGCASLAGAAGSLVLAPSSTSVEAGDSFSVQVRGAAFAEFVVGGGFSLAFDPALLNLDSVVINTAVWEFAPGTGTIDNAAGTLTDAFFNTFAAVQPTGDFLAATLNFSAMAPGAGTLTLLPSALFPFADSTANVISVSFGSADVTVTAVPEPATWLSMGLGLTLLPLLRRRRAR